MASSVRMKKYSYDAKKVLKKITNLDSDLKKAKEKLTIEKAARQASDASAAKYKLEVNVG